ncbi:MAG TPA: MGMT family protein [Candidatus Limnocylindrales bacterium]|nr:MGMT family protein [Candidatus Limnocylindrales bacterium]
MKQSKSPFTKKVIDAVQVIPTGKVASYGQIALYIGFPRVARQVGWTLRQIGAEINLPWWKVVNKKGAISINGNLHADRDLQKKLLQADGIDVEDFQVDMEKYRFVASPQQLKDLQLSEDYIQSTVTKFSI